MLWVSREALHAAATVLAKVKDSTPELRHVVVDGVTTVGSPEVASAIADHDTLDVQGVCGGGLGWEGGAGECPEFPSSRGMAALSSLLC